MCLRIGAARGSPTEPDRRSRPLNDWLSCPWMMAPQRVCLPAQQGMPYDGDPGRGGSCVEVRAQSQGWQAFAARFHEIEANVERVVRGKHEEIRLALVALV